MNKHIIFFLLAFCMLSCNTKPVATTQSFKPTPNGLQDIIKPVVTNPTSFSKTSNLILNPKHGETGHRCDLAVGAPLNSVPTKTATPQPSPQNVSTTTTSQVVTQPTPVATVNAKGQKINPPHGQPNHRCDIAVGALLTAKAPVASQPVAAAPTITTPVSKEGVKLNPAHGQPNHRCDVAVGAPLT